MQQILTVSLKVRVLFAGMTVLKKLLIVLPAVMFTSNKTWKPAECLLTGVSKCLMTVSALTKKIHVQDVDLEECLLTCC